MQNPNPILEQLHDIQLPEPIGWWPLAFSWWILIFSVTSILIGMLWYYLDLKRRNAYRVTALKKLQQIQQQPDLNNQQKIERINRLLKQVAITTYGRREVAPLYDRQWVEFLSSTSSYIAQPQDLLQTIQLAYRDMNPQTEATSQAALDSLVAYAQKWIKGHHQ